MKALGNILCIIADFLAFYVGGFGALIAVVMGEIGITILLRIKFETKI